MSQDIRFKSLQEAIIARVQSQLPAIATLSGGYDWLPNNVALPAFAFHIARFEPGLDRGTGALCLNAHYEGRLFLNAKAPDTSHLGQGLATQLAKVLHQQSLLPELPHTRITGIQLEAFPPEGAICWLIEWEQDLQRGDNPHADWVEPYNV
jgi:hypothetical protein